MWDFLHKYGIVSIALIIGGIYYYIIPKVNAKYIKLWVVMITSIVGGLCTGYIAYLFSIQGTLIIAAIGSLCFLFLMHLFFGTPKKDLS